MIYAERMVKVSLLYANIDYVFRQIQYFRSFSAPICIGTSEVNSVFDSIQIRSNTISAVQLMNVGYLGVHKKRIIIENLPLPLFAKEG